MPTSPQTYSVTATELEDLRTACTQAKSRAYCPYSHFRVGAALLTHSGTLIPGANVENASYPVTICAERVALGTAVVSFGCGRADFKALGVATDISPPASLCGMCRQCVREFCDLAMPVFMFDKDGEYVVKTLEELLPMSFGPEALLDPQQLPS